MQKTVGNDFRIFMQQILRFPYQIKAQYNYEGAKGDWDFQIFDLVKNPDGTDI